MSTDIPVTTEGKKRSWQIPTLFAITVLPIVAAYVAYFTGIGVPKDTVNEGTLITGAGNIKELLHVAEGDLPALEHNRKWRLFVPISTPCNDECQQLLYVSRQVHIRLAEKADRVERFAVNLSGDDGAAFLASIAKEHPKLSSFSVNHREFASWISSTNIPQNASAHPYVLLVDQVGFAMMFYDIKNDGNQMLKDIKRVLRFSPE